MRVIIAGSRGVMDAARLNRAIRNAQFDISTVVSGMCPDSPDMLGVAWAKRQEPVVSVDPFPADWDKYGKRAGMIRNCQMAKKADALIALWDGKSKGTQHMIIEAVEEGLYHYIDATCMDCGRPDDVALYKLEKNGVEDLRATCRPCLVERLQSRKMPLEIVTYMDIFKMWGTTHTLHTHSPRRVPAEPKAPLPLPLRAVVPGLKFGQKPKPQQKQIKALMAQTPQDSLFEDKSYVD